MVAGHVNPSSVKVVDVFKNNWLLTYSAEIGYLYAHRCHCLYLQGGDGRWYPHSCQGRLLKKRPSYDSILPAAYHYSCSKGYIVKNNGLCGVLTRENRLIIPLKYHEVEFMDNGFYCGTHSLPDGTPCYDYYYHSKLIKQSAEKFQIPRSWIAICEHGRGINWTCLNEDFYFAEYGKTYKLYAHHDDQPHYNGEARIAYLDDRSHRLCFIHNTTFFAAGDVISVFLRSPFAIYFAVQRGNKWMVLDSRCAPLLPSWVDGLAYRKVLSLRYVNDDYKMYSSLRTSYTNLIDTYEDNQRKVVALPAESVPGPIYRFTKRVINAAQGGTVVMADVSGMVQEQIECILKSVFYPCCLYRISCLAYERFFKGQTLLFAGTLDNKRFSASDAYLALYKLTCDDKCVILNGKNDALFQEMLKNHDISFALISK